MSYPVFYNLADSCIAPGTVITHRAIKNAEGCLWFLKVRKKNEIRHSSLKLYDKLTAISQRPSSPQVMIDKMQGSLVLPLHLQTYKIKFIYAVVKMESNLLNRYHHLKKTVDKVGQP